MQGMHDGGSTVCLRAFNGIGMLFSGSSPTIDLIYLFLKGGGCHRVPPCIHAFALEYQETLLDNTHPRFGGCLHFAVHEVAAQAANLMEGVLDKGSYPQLCRMCHLVLAPSVALFRMVKH